MAGAVEPRADCGTQATGQEDRADPDLGAAAAAIFARLAALTGQPSAELATRWPDTASKRLAIVIGPSHGTGPGHGWVISCEDSGLVLHKETAPDTAETMIMATGSTWLAILAGRANLAAELRAGRLRLTTPALGERSNAGGIPPPELHLLAQLLGLAANMPAHHSAQEVDTAITSACPAVKIAVPRGSNRTDAQEGTT